MNEFNLSEKTVIARHNGQYALDFRGHFLRIEDVKEAIKILKEELRTDKQGKYYFSESEQVCSLIDKIMGDKLHD